MAGTPYTERLSVFCFCLLIADLAKLPNQIGLTIIFVDITLRLIYVCCMHNNKILISQFIALSVAIIDKSILADKKNSPSKISALLTLLHWPKLGVTELANIVGLSQSATTRLIDTLAQEQLVKRERENRTARLHLTSKGNQLAKSFQNQQSGVIGEIISVLDESQKKQLADIVHKIMYGLVKDPDEARRLCRYCDHSICSGSNCPVGTKARSLKEEKGEPHY